MTAFIGWNRRTKLTADKLKVTGTHSGFVVKLTESNFPSEIFDADGANPAQNGGGDLRFSSDANGDNRLGCDIVSFVTNNNPALGTCEIYVEFPSVSDITDEAIYCFYNNTQTQNQPAASAAFGSESVYNADYKGMWHWTEDDTDTAPEFKDSSGNANHATAYLDQTAQASANLAGDGESLDFLNTVGATSNVATARISPMGSMNQGMIIADVEISQISTRMDIFGHTDNFNSNHLALKIANNRVAAQFSNTTTNGNTITTGRRLVALGWDSGTAEMYLDGVKHTSSVTYSIIPGTDNAATLFGGLVRSPSTNNNPLDGKLFNSRFYNVDKGEEFVSTLYTSETDTAFITSGTPVDVAGVGKTIVITLTGDTFVDTPASKDAIIAGAVSGGAESAGWNNKIKAFEDYKTCTISGGGTVFTWQLRAHNDYQVDNDETITITIPAASLTTSETDIVVTPTFSISAEHELAGTPTGQASASGTLTTAINITGAAVGQATSTGTLTTSIPLSGASASVATANGDIITSIKLDAAAVATAAASGALTTGETLDGAAGAIAGASGALTTSIQLDGGAIATAAASGNLSIGDSLDGNAAASASSTGDIITGIPLAGNASASVSGTGNLTTLIKLDGAAASVNSVTGDLTVSITLNADALATMSAGGTLTTQIKLDGGAVASAISSGVLSVGAYQLDQARKRVLKKVNRFRVLPSISRIRKVAS